MPRCEDTTPPPIAIARDHRIARYLAACAIIASMRHKAQLIVRNLDPVIVAALRTRAALTGRSMEAEHREILKSALRKSRRRTSFKEWLTKMPNVGTDRDFVRTGAKARGVRL